MIIAAASLHPSTVSYLELLLKRQVFSSIIIVGRKEKEAAIKQLKIDVYALIGRMQKEYGVHTYAAEAWNEAVLQGIVQDATKNGEIGIHGILCCPEYDNAKSLDPSINALSSDHLQQSWSLSVGFLHAICQSTLPQLQSRPQFSEYSAETRQAQSPFFIIADQATHTAACQISKSACDTLVTLVGQAPKSQNLTVGYAEALLIPDPEPIVEHNKTSLAEKRTTMVPYISTGGIENQSITPSDSPTELWNLWSSSEQFFPGD